MPLMACAVLPHSPMVLSVDDPDSPPIPDGLREMHAGCTEVVERIARCVPELIVLLTPHGIPVNVAGKSGKPGE